MVPQSGALQSHRGPSQFFKLVYGQSLSLVKFGWAQPSFLNLETGEALTKGRGNRRANVSGEPRASAKYAGKLAELRMDGCQCCTLVQTERASPVLVCCAGVVKMSVKLI